MTEAFSLQFSKINGIGSITLHLQYHVFFVSATHGTGTDNGAAIQLHHLRVMGMAVKYQFCVMLQRRTVNTGKALFHTIDMSMRQKNLSAIKFKLPVRWFHRHHIAISAYRGKSSGMRKIDLMPVALTVTQEINSLRMFPLDQVLESRIVSVGIGTNDDFHNQTLSLCHIHS